MQWCTIVIACRCFCALLRHCLQLLCTRGLKLLAFRSSVLYLKRWSPRLWPCQVDWGCWDKSPRVWRSCSSRSQPAWCRIAGRTANSSNCSWLSQRMKELAVSAHLLILSFPGRERQTLPEFVRCFESSLLYSAPQNLPRCLRGWFGAQSRIGRS